MLEFWILDFGSQANLEEVEREKEREKEREEERGRGRGTYKDFFRWGGKG
jgi:hypothetical protein